MEKQPVILIAGAHGFVGERAMAHFPGAVPVESGLLRGPEEALIAFVEKVCPDIILNAAAISDIGTCEKDPEGSWRANVLLPVALARAAEKTGAGLISFSSDQVYTGLADPGPYREDTPLPAPANVYARHKLEAEQRVLEVHPGAVVLRATWMYDMPMENHRNRGNFLVNALEALAQGRPISVPARQHRGITYVRQVVQLLEPAFRLPGGVYNFGSENPLDMADTARALLDALGKQGTVSDLGQLRHNLWMDCGKLESCGIRFDTTARGFARCVRDYGLKNPE